MTSRPCRLCHPPGHQLIEETPLVRSVWDGHPVADGHALVVVRRHVGRLSDTTAEERAEIFEAVERTKQLIDARHSPDAYTVGINDGPAAGQSIPHLHVHVIPRYAGDRPDPRGGVRWVLPERAAYWR